MVKTVVVDFSYLGILCGFGNIAEHYSRRLAESPTDDLHFVFIVPERYVGAYGPHIDYLRREHLRADADAYPRQIDLWHATSQAFTYRRHARGTRQLLTIHDLNFLYEKKHIHRLKHLLRLQYMVGRSDALSVISNYVKTDLERHVTLWGKPVEVIYNGVNVPDATHASRPDFIADGEPFFMALGQVLEKKNFQRLVPMMRHFPDHRLYICGDTQFPYAQTLRDIIRREHADNCIVAGRISEAEKTWMYQHCRAFLMASQSEGFGLPVVEAMQMRCPVVLARATSLSEIGSRYAHYWDRLDDARQMADVVRHCMSAATPQLLADEQQYALSFSYERYTQSYLQLYRRILNL